MNQINSNKDLVKEKMYSYACEKYNQSFDIVNFEYALRGLDANRSDILTLSAGDDFVFNVTHSPEDIDCVELYDDYYVEVLEQKFADYIAGQSKGAYILNTVVMLKNDYSDEEIDSLTVPELIVSKGLRKLVVIAAVDTRNNYINEHLSEIYSLYNYVCSLNPQYIDFEFVVFNGMTEKLSECIRNPRKNYENDWETYSNILEYLSVNELSLSSDDFANRIVKV